MYKYCYKAYMSKFTHSSICWEILLLVNYGCSADDSYSRDKQCPICLDDLKEEYTITLPCGHTYHRNCILSNIFLYKRYKCPDPKCDKLLSLTNR
jgi:hypothetical protein